MTKEKTLIEKAVSESKYFAANAVARKAIELVFKDKIKLDLYLRLNKRIQDNRNYRGYRFKQIVGEEVEKLKRECLK